MRKTTIVIVLGAAAGTAHANGFVLNDHGARATGRADAVVATDTDGTSIVHNIGGLAVQDGIGVHIGASLIIPSSSFECQAEPCAGTKTDTDSPVSVTPQVYITARVHDLISIGFGFHTPFGSKIVWPDTAPTLDEVHTQELRTYFLTPAVGLNLDKFVPGLTFGAGVDLVPATVELTQNIYFGDAAAGSATLGGNAFGVGFRAGVQYRPRMVPGLSLGAAYRSEVKLDFDGKGDFDIADPFRDQLPPDGDISTSITLPQAISGGVAYRPLPPLELELDAVWMGWSSFDKLEIELPDMSTTISPRDYKNTLSIRFGAEYALRTPVLKLDLRAGYMYDPSPVPKERLTPALPDINRHDLTAGASYHLRNYRIDFGMLWVLPGSRTTGDEMFEPTYKGKYELTAFVASLSLSGRFGSKSPPAGTPAE